MTRTLAQVEEALRLHSEGLGARRISHAIGVPVRTVTGWLGNPTVALARPRTSGRGTDCNAACEPWAGLDPKAYSYLLGMYLGDGTISKMPRTYRLRIYCCDDYPKIMDEVEAAIRNVLPTTVGRVHKEGCTEVGAYSKHWPCFFPQHGPGVKHERPIVLAPWQVEVVEAKPRLFVRGLIQSDGWRGYNVAIRETDLYIQRHRYTRYMFTNKSDDIRDLFCWSLDLLGVHWTQSNKYVISVSRRKDVHYLDSFVGPKR